MTKLKKIIAPLMIVLMLVNLMAAAAEEGDIQTEEPALAVSVYQDSIDRLEALGFLELEEGEDFYPDNQMTRAEFITLAMKLVGISETVNMISVENIFVDVRDDLWYAPYIAYALELGVLSQNPERLFRPDDAITASEALKIMVAAMGYDQTAKQRGGYPEGYMTVAYELDLVGSMRLSANELLSRGQAARILDNCLEQDVMVVDTVYGDLASFEKQNLLERHDMYAGKGIVTANEATALDRPTSLDENQIELDNRIVCSTGETDAKNYLGYQVEYVYQEDTDGELILRYIKPNKDNREMIVQAEDITGAGSGYIRVQPEQGAAKSYNISNNAYILYNGCYVESFSEDMLMPEQGTVKLLANDGGVFNVVFIEEYTNIYVGGKSDMDGIIYDKYDPENEVCLSPDDVTLLYEIEDTQGTPLTIDDIVIGDVVSVYRSMEGKHIRAVVSRDTVQGAVTGITKKNRVTVNEETYKTTQQLYRYMNEEKYDIGMIRAGMNVLLHLDAYGYVAGYETMTDTGRKVAYMKGAVLAGDNLDTILVKLFTAEGNHEKYLCAERVRIDGTYYKEYEEIYEALCGNRDYVVGRPITYTLNTENEITYIDTPAQGSNEEDGTLFQTYAGYTYNDATNTYDRSGSFLTYKNKMMSLGMQILLKDTTPIFVIPQTDPMDADDNYFSIKNISELQNDEQVYCDSYQLNRDSYYADIIVQYTNTASTTTIDNNSNVAVVKEISDAVYHDEPCTQLTVVIDGKETMLYPKDEEIFHNIKGRNTQKVYANFQPGDVFRYRKLADDTVGAVEMLIGTEGERLGNGSTAKEIAYVEESNKFAQMRFATRNVYGKKDSIIRLTAEEPSGVPESDVYSLEVQKASSFQIIVVDTSGRAVDVRKGTVNDIRDFKSCGGSYSTVLVQTRYGDARTIVVFDQEINQ